MFFMSQLSNFSSKHNMISDVANQFVSVVCDGWSWWWDGSTIQGQFGRVVFTLFIAVLMISWSSWLMKNLRKREFPLPPGPQGLPLLGNLPFLEADLHLYFVKLAKTYGPIFKFQLGNKMCVVLSSPSLVKEVLRDHDAIFANRDAPIAGLAVTYGGQDIAWSPNGPMWRNLRRLLVHKMLSSSNLDSCYALREREVRETMRQVYAKVGTPINIGEQTFLTILNVIMSMLWGGKLQGEVRTRVGVECRQVIREIVELLGRPNVSDIFPVLARFDLQGIEHRSKNLLAWFDRIFDSIIDQRLKMDRGEGARTYNGKESKDFLELLLEEKDSKTPLTMMQLKGLFMDIIVGGTDSTATTLEWAIAEMIQHSEVMKKAQAELDGVVGTNNMVQDFHLPSLPYLDAVIKETLRLHPAVPLLVPHCPNESCIVGEYTIPKGARVFFNAWAMQRDPEIWEDPLTFKPERFLCSTQKSDYNGNCFSFLPFGSGRRICAGIPLAERMSTYILASLLHSFEWRLPEGTSLDLSETFGLVLKKTIPLIAIPTPRLLNQKLYN